LNRKILLGSVVVLTLLGFALRFYRLNAVSLRGDEAFTVLHWMREPLAQTLANIATVDPQAPLSYVLYRGWGLLMGTQEDVARVLPALLSVIGIPAMYALAHRLRGPTLGLLAALLWAIHPYEIWHAQDARNYAIWAMLSLLAIWLALRALDRGRRIDWALYVAAAALAAYVYYLELFVLLVLNIYVFGTRWRDRRLLVQWIASQVVIGLLLAPWYLQPRLLFGSGYGGTAGRFEPLQLLTRFLPGLTFGDHLLPADVLTWLAPVLALALLVGLALWWRKDRRQALLVGLLGTLPLLLIGVVSTRLNVFEPRYVLAAAPAYVLILSVLALELRRRVLIIPAVVALAAMSVFALSNYYFVRDYAKAPNWRALAQYLARNTYREDWITQAAADESFTFYCKEYLLWANCDDKLPANPNQSAEEIEMLLAERSQQHEEFWYVASPPPDWANAHVAQDWLTANLQPVVDTSADGMRAQLFMPWDVPVAPSATMGTFGDTAELVGVDWSVEPTGDVTLWLYWHALAQTDVPLKIFVHMTKADDEQIASQDDQYPQDGRISTTSWEVGKIYRDVYHLPAPPLENRVIAYTGFYDPETNRRLPVGDGDRLAVLQLVPEDLFIWLSPD
jgi:hypothetical protein